MAEVYGRSSGFYEPPKILVELVLGVSYLAKRALGIIRLPVHDYRLAYGRPLNPHLLFADSQTLPGRFVFLSELSLT